MDTQVIIGYLGTDDFVFGKQWSSVPISHDILRIEQWIYSTYGLHTPNKQVLNDRRYVFFKFDIIPDKEERETIEWKTVDLLNNIKTCSGVYGYNKTINDVITAINRKQLDYKMLTELTYKFGNTFTKNLMNDVLIKGDKVLYNDTIYYYQPNGSYCYLYEKAEDIGNMYNKSCAAQTQLVKKILDNISL